MYAKLFICLALAFAVSSAYRILIIIECPTGSTYLFETNSCYKNVGTHDSYVSARSTCVEQGGELAMPKSATQNAFIYTVAGMTDAWIGLRDARREGRYMWADGTQMQYSNWRTSTGEPNNVDNEDCVFMKSDSEGQWNDQGCVTSTNAVVCQFPAIEWQNSIT